MLRTMGILKKTCIEIIVLLQTYVLLPNDIPIKAQNKQLNGLIFPQMKTSEIKQLEKGMTIMYKDNQTSRRTYQRLKIIDKDEKSHKLTVHWCDCDSNSESNLCYSWMDPGEWHKYINVERIEKYWIDENFNKKNNLFVRSSRGDDKTKYGDFNFKILGYIQLKSVRFMQFRVNVKKGCFHAFPRNTDDIEPFVPHK